MNQQKLLLAAAILSLAAPACSTQTSKPNTQAASKADDSYCLTQTGSRIQRKEGECVPSPGKSYSQEDLQRTGEFDNSKALRRLDPSVR